MSDDAAVVWLDRSGGATEADVTVTTGRGEAARALVAWAAARGIRLVDAEPSKPGLVADPTLADRVEKELAHAYEAIGGADMDAAERALARAETLLRDHPELPQSAWQRAEVERAWATRWLRGEPRDEGRARAAWQNAEALDGGRVAGVGESTFAPRAAVKASILVAGGASNAILRLDGRVIARTSESDRGALYELTLTPTEHHLSASIDERLVFASWVAIIGADPPPVRLTLTDGGGCAPERLGRVRRSADDPRAVDARGATCPSWIAAAAGERRGSVLVARCERDACGPLLEWRTESSESRAAPQDRARSGAWPAWATWTAGFALAATAATIAIVATGVLEAPRVEPRFVVGGARQE